MFGRKFMLAAERGLPACLLALACLASGCDSQTPSPNPQASPPANPAQTLPAGGSDLRGEDLAKSYCATCHLTPSPGELDKATWRDELLPKMRYLVGLTPPDPRVFEDLPVLLQGGVFPSAPLIPEWIFKKISDYYIAAAPETLPRHPAFASPSPDLASFRPEALAWRNPTSVVTMVHISSDLAMLTAGDAESQGLRFFDDAGKMLSKVALGNIPVRMSAFGKDFVFATIGHFFPREDPKGQLMVLERNPQGLNRQVLASNLPRPSDLQIADLNGDGIPDMVTCLFGNYIGRFSWWEGSAASPPREHVLWDKPGALQSRIHDFNGDGRPDLAVLFAQSQESMFLFLNDGKGGFERRMLFQRHPSWGHAGFDIGDFNGDGRMDLLVVNGDNADFSRATLKPYHGIRIYEDQGGLEFKETWFQPLPGAYQAQARDYDGDGDLDIAAISFFPDYERVPLSSFLFLERVGPLEFKPRTFPEAADGRWLCMDSGDLDGDGDIDIALGSLTRMPTLIPAPIKANWSAKAVTVMVLRNTTK